MLSNAREQEVVHCLTHAGCCRVFCPRLTPPGKTKAILLLEVQIKIPFPEVQIPPHTRTAGSWYPLKSTQRNTFSLCDDLYSFTLLPSIPFCYIWIPVNTGRPTREVQTFIRAWSLVRQVSVFSRGFASLTKWCLPRNCSIPLSRKIKPHCQRRNPITSLWNDSGTLLDWWSSLCCFPFFSVCKRLCDFFF